MQSERVSSLRLSKAIMIMVNIIRSHVNFMFNGGMSFFSAIKSWQTQQQGSY